MWWVFVSCSEFGVSSIVRDPPPEVPTGDTAPARPEEPALPPGAAEAPVYAHTATELFTIDPTTGERSRVGAFRDGGEEVFGMVDIAIDLTGRMYGGTFDALYQVDPTTAALSPICELDLVPYALTFTSEGDLFAGAGLEVVELNPRTCAATALAPAGEYYTSGDLVGLPDQFLYWTVRGEPNDQLVKIDPYTGATFLVGEIAYDRLFGLGYADGALYGFSENGPIVRIDPSTAATERLTDDRTAWWGATTNPVKW